MTWFSFVITVLSPFLLPLVYFPAIYLIGYKDTQLWYLSCTFKYAWISLALTVLFSGLIITVDSIPMGILAVILALLDSNSFVVFWIAMTTIISFYIITVSFCVAGAQWLAYILVAGNSSELKININRASLTFMFMTLGTGSIFPLTNVFLLPILGFLYLDHSITLSLYCYMCVYALLFMPTIHFIASGYIGERVGRKRFINNNQRSGVPAAAGFLSAFFVLTIGIPFPYVLWYQNVLVATLWFVSASLIWLAFIVAGAIWLVSVLKSTAKATDVVYLEDDFAL